MDLTFEKDLLTRIEELARRNGYGSALQVRQMTARDVELIAQDVASNAGPDPFRFD